jgi:hypothetical protein
MKLLLSTVIFCSGLLLSLQSLAELAKLRSWPAAISVPSAELKKQYEYDPAAGAISDKLISVETTIGHSAGSSTTKTNYVNGAPVSGTGDWAVGMSAYHGFASIMAFSMTTESINYRDSGNWPAKSIKVHSVTSLKSMANYEQRSISECTQSRSFSAGSMFPTLPGKIYEYKCVGTGSTYMLVSNQGVENGLPPTRYTAYYSDYLDMNLMSKVEGSPQWSIYKVQFMGADKKPGLLSYRNDQIAIP